MMIRNQALISERTKRTRLETPRHQGCGRSRPGRRRWGQAGAIEIVQVAILAPIALLLLLGIVEMAIGFFNQSVLANASRVAAREAIRATPPPDGWPDELAPRVDQAARAAAAGLLRWGTAQTLVVEIDPEEPLDAAAGGEVTVTLRYPHAFLYLDALGTVNLEARTRMRVFPRLE